VNTLLPQTQLLLAGKTSPSAFATKIQTDYESDLGKWPPASAARRAPHRS